MRHAYGGVRAGRLAAGKRLCVKSQGLNTIIYINQVMSKAKSQQPELTLELKMDIKTNIVISIIKLKYVRIGK